MDLDNIKRQKLATYAKWGLALLAAAVISPIIFFAVKGLIGLALAGLIGLTIVNFAPVVAMKFANWKVKAITHEAKQNPIETMQNLLFAKREAFQIFKQNVENAITATKAFEQKTIEFSKKYPHRAAEFQRQLENMKELISRKTEALKDARNVLEVAENKLAEMKAYWEISQAAQAANQAAGMDTGDLYEKLKADTAVDAVFESMNRAFAQLEVAAALDENSTPLQLENSNVVEVANVPLQLEKERVRV